MQNILPVHFAPLQGYTEAPYRNAHAEYFGGIDTYHAPFVRLDKGTFRSKDIRDIEPQNNQVPQLVPQLIASEANNAELILNLFIEKGYQKVDINLGCPFPLLAKRHKGSGLLPYPEEVKSLLSIVEQHPQILFSVKMRLGWEDTEECLALLPILNDLPLKQITMHPRLGKQQYKGEVDLDGFEAFYNSCQHPLIYNGDILHANDIQKLCNRFPKLAGVMIGRGLLANPALALEYQSGKPLEADEMKAKLHALHRSIFSYYENYLQGGEHQLLDKTKPFWEYLTSETEKKYKKAILKSTSISKYEQAVSAFFNHYK